MIVSVSVRVSASRDRISNVIPDISHMCKISGIEETLKKSRCFMVSSMRRSWKSTGLEGSRVSKCTICFCRGERRKGTGSDLLLLRWWWVLWISGSDSECRIVVTVTVTVTITIAVAELIFLEVKGSTPELAGRKGKGGCGWVQCLTAEEETEMLEIQTWILHVAWCCLLLFYVVDRSVNLGASGKGIIVWTNMVETRSSWCSESKMDAGCYKFKLRMHRSDDLFNWIQDTVQVRSSS